MDTVTWVSKGISCWDVGEKQINNVYKCSLLN